ncbi:phosphate ABC transporter permease subunit PstC [Camelliibacillus cellulosilyticus]|uniref:Phosphate transport system permease protein n=1 Tax=Camelliibacillus cellulosilyticus TaxID=2174486 RepID=A0ABV9GKN6_9BACL
MPLIKRWHRDWKAKLFIYLSAGIVILSILAITLFLLIKGSQSFIKDGVNIIQLVTGTDWRPTDQSPSYGAFSFIFGSFAVTLLAAFFAAPIAIGSAIYMTEMAPSGFRKIYRPMIEILVGIPSVVYGFIGLSVLVPFMRGHIGGLGFGILSAAIVCAVMILPTVTSVAMEAVQSVPGYYREASYALGSTRWQTIYRVVMPQAWPMLMTAVILGMARAFGEAMAVQMVIGNASVIPHSLMEPAATLTTVITLNLGNTTYGSSYNDVLWSLGLILLLMSYLFILAIRLLSRRRQKI